MYVCLCNPVTDRQIRSCVQQGARSLCELQAQLGVAAQCGMCAATALAIVDEETHSGRAHGLTEQVAA
jgi:bacterioferritin-associated ferredoxin